jgi:hypothetical protein
MTHDELLARIAKLSITPETNVVPSELATALMTVVELHKPREGVWWISNPSLLACSTCEEWTWNEPEPAVYPCSTIQAIEKELK